MRAMLLCCRASRARRLPVASPCSQRKSRKKQALRSIGPNSNTFQQIASVTTRCKARADEPCPGRSPGGESNPGPRFAYAPRVSATCTEASRRAPSDSVAHALGVSTGRVGGRGGGEAIAEHGHLEPGRAQVCGDVSGCAQAVALRRGAAIARRAHDSRAARSCRARVLCLSLPTVVGWRVGSQPTQMAKWVCVGGAAVWGQCLWGGGLGAGGGVGALAPVELWVLGPLAGWLGLAVRGWVTWHDLPAGQWIGLGSGRGLGIAAPPSHRPMPREQGRKCGHGERGAVHGRSRPGRGGRWACGTR